MNEPSYQWMNPLGTLSAPISLDELRAQAEQGRLFPAHGVSRYGGEPVAASALPELREVWAKISPPSTPFDGAEGRARPIVLARFFAELSLSRASGYLTLRQQDAALFFSMRIVEGQLLEICAHDPSTYLGQLLVQQGRLTPSDLTRLLKLASERGEAVGKVGIDEGLLSQKELNKALAEQLFTRLRRIACFPKFDLRFRPDRRARLAPPVARVSGYAALEITLGYGLDDQEIKDYLSVLRARPTLIDVQAPGLSLLSAEDRNVLKRIHQTQDLSPLTDRPQWTQRDGALKAIAWDMLRIFTMPRAYALTEELNHLNAPNALQHLGLDEHASWEERGEAAQRYRESLALSAPSENDDEEQVKQLLRRRLDELTRPPQLSPREAAAVERMRQMGASLEDEQLKAALMFEGAFQEGEAALKRSRYAEAHERFLEALTYKPSDLAAQLKSVWSSFLSSDRSEGAYLAVKQRAEQLIRSAPKNIEPLLILAQIQRIYGDSEQAELTLRTILKLDPEHPQANAELRLLINREFDEKKKKRNLLSGGDAQHGLGSQAARLALGALLFLSATLWGAGALTPSERVQWPEVKRFELAELNSLNPLDRRRTFYQAMRTNYDQELVMSASYRLGLKPPIGVTGDDEAGYDLSGLGDDTMRELTRSLSYLYDRFEREPTKVKESLSLSRLIPQELRVLGVVEGYWLSEDLFWWARRLALIALALIGLAYVKPWQLDREARAPKSAEPQWRLEPTSAPALWTVGALVYGAVVGFLSPSIVSPTSLGTLSLMLGLHVVAEQLAFSAYLGGALLKGTRGLPLASLGAVVATFAVYKLSFFYMWQQPSGAMWLSLLQMSLFIEGASVALMWKTRSLLPPLVAQLTLTLTPLLTQL